MSGKEELYTGPDYRKKSSQTPTIVTVGPGYTPLDQAVENGWITPEEAAAALKYPKARTTG